MRRVVTSYTMHRSASGRLTSGVDSSEPDKLRGKVTQVQNIPRGVRDIVVPLPGHKLMQGDWAGIEWAISMWMCGKHSGNGFHFSILDRFQRSEFDPHRYLASFAFNKPESEVTPEERKICKPYTHGRTYLGSPRTLARNAGHTDSVGIKVCAAHEAAFRVGPWQKEVLAQTKKRHYVQTPLGWRRYFWAWDPKPTEVIATLVSGAAADLCKVVLGTIFADLPEGWEVLTTTHDSVLLMVPKEADDAPAWLRRHMEQPIPWLDGRSWRADIKVGNNWKEVS